MRIPLVLFLIIAFVGNISAQKKRKSKEKSLFVSTSLSFYSAEESYFFTEDLPFLDGHTEFLFLVPSPKLNFGISFQLRSKNSVFQEFAMSRLSHSKSFDEREMIYLSQNFSEILSGSELVNTIVGLRYEYGKFFGKDNTSENEAFKVRFGLSGILEPTLHLYRFTPSTTSHGFPLNVSMVNLNLSVVPILSFNISANLNLDFKLLPTVFIGQLGIARTKNPNFILNKQKELPTSSMDFGDFNMGGTVQLRYTIREVKVIK